MKKEPRDRICMSRGSAHVEERYLPCVDGSCRLCGAPDRDVKVRHAFTAKKSALTRQSPQTDDTCRSCSILLLRSCATGHPAVRTTGRVMMEFGFRRVAGSRVGVPGSASCLDERREITTLVVFVCLECSPHSPVMTLPFARFVRSVRSFELIRDA
jgi:hypothetical protein